MCKIKPVSVGCCLLHFFLCIVENKLCFRSLKTAVRCCLPLDFVQIPIKGARMLLSSVAKCMTTNYYAIIYDHDHSKHINDHLRCRQNNGATCLNCKVDITQEMLTAASLLSSPRTFEMQAVWVSRSARSSVHTHALFSISPYLSLPLSVSLFTVPWYDQRQLCDTV